MQKNSQNGRVYYPCVATILSNANEYTVSTVTTLKNTLHSRKNSAGLTFTCGTFMEV